MNTLRDDNATARCLRLAVGIRDTELEHSLNTAAGAVAAWEDMRGPVGEGALDMLADMASAAADETVRLIEQAADTGQIITFLDDAMTVAATDGHLTLASVHRVCAGRAAMAVPTAAVLLCDGDGDGEHRPGWLACVAAACGMGMGHVRKWFDVPRRAAGYWLTGRREPPAGVLTEMRDIATSVRGHVDELVDQVDQDDPVIWVCATEDQMEARWPNRVDLPLPTHQVCAARAAAAIPDSRLVFLAE